MLVNKKNTSKRLSYTFVKSFYKNNKTKKKVLKFPYSYARFIKKNIENDPTFFRNKNNKKSDYSTKNSLSNIVNNLISVNLRFLNSKIFTSLFFKDKHYIPETWNKDKKYKKNMLWYCKPDRGSLGKGIIVTKHPKRCDNSKFVIQKSVDMNYINNRRWDLRIHVIHRIHNNHFETWVYHDGMLRLSPSTSSDSNKKTFRVTNTDLYSKLDNPDNLNFCFKKYPLYDIYFKKIEKVLIDIHNEFNKLKFIQKKKNQFQLYGYDFIFTREDEPKLLEINTRPASYKDNGKSHSTKCMEMMNKMYSDIFNNFIKSPLLDNNDLDTNFINESKTKIQYSEDIEPNLKWESIWRTL